MEMEVAVPISDCFFFLLKTNSYMSINNLDFTPCKFILFETNLEGVYTYAFAKICILNE